MDHSKNRASFERKLWGDAVKNVLRERMVRDTKAMEVLGMLDVSSFNRLLREGRYKDETRDIYSAALGRLCGISPDAFDKPNGQYRPTSYGAYAAAEEIGQTKTLWLPMYGTGEETFAWDSVECTYLGNHCPLPPRYSTAFQTALLDLKPHEENRIRECLLKAELNERGDRYEKRLELSFGYSDYASKRVVTSTLEGRKLAHEELSVWAPGKPLLPYLHVGVGCHVIIITSDGKTTFARRRNPLRHGELDTGAVEGLAPYLDKLWLSNDVKAEEQKKIWSEKKGTQFDLRTFFLRALKEEYRIEEPEIIEMNFFGLGLDLFYGQWNFLGSAYVSKTFAELEASWPRATSRDENYPVWPVDFAVSSIEKAVRDERIWSSAIAALIYALRWHYKTRLKIQFPYIRGRNHSFKMTDEDQYRLLS